MNPQLDLRLHITSQQITIVAGGQLTALTAHLLPKVVIGTLRRHPAAALELDLTGITAVDFAGEMALQDCEYETQRRGILFTVTRHHPHRPQPPAPVAAALHTRRFRPPMLTGTICRRWIASI